MTMFVTKVMIAFAVLIGAVFAITREEVIAEKLNSAPDKDSRCHEVVPHAVCAPYGSELYPGNPSLSAWYYDPMNKMCRSAVWTDLGCRENRDLPKTKQECEALCGDFSTGNFLDCLGWYPSYVRPVFCP